MTVAPLRAQFRSAILFIDVVSGGHEQKLALDKIDAALRLQPNNPDVLLASAIVYQQLGDSSRALNSLEKAVSEGTTPDTIRDTPNFSALSDNPRFLVLIHGDQVKHTE